ncbi:MAG: hypothetical protein AVDCRST_MAG89-62, partial [uncultured Gemmatimonadetes bacterium]
RRSDGGSRPGRHARGALDGTVRPRPLHVFLPRLLPFGRGRPARAARRVPGAEARRRVRAGDDAPRPHPGRFRRARLVGNRGRRHGVGGARVRRRRGRQPRVDPLVAGRGLGREVPRAAHPFRDGVGCATAAGRHGAHRLVGRLGAGPVPPQQRKPDRRLPPGL